ncbi:hypothetical protein BKA61DRAFT_252907 [Leptodontidium sp. MPI-SDFR-AT-0119]|nr:hypothetical protein BKA61DRAFT_252907 [Leptodontidium sp. MPI-SDFR-AT-0119]
MDSSRLTPPLSSTCGRCGYSACICYKTASKAAPAEYAPFGIYPGAVPSTERHNAIGYGDFTNRFHSEVDGLQAGVDYLDTIEEQAEETPLGRIPGKSLKRLLELEEQGRDLGTRWKNRERVDKTPQNLATPDVALDTYSIPPHCIFDLHDSYTDQFFQDGTVPSLVDVNDDSWNIQFDYEGNECDWPELSEDIFSQPGPAQEQLTSVAYESVRIHSHEERGYASQQYTCSKEVPTINEVPSEETTNVEIDKPPTIAKKVPQKSQWATLQELRLSSKFHYMKFLRLTANHNSRGIKMLRRMYGSPKGMLGTGITTFRDVLEGQKPQSLKEIFAFTCLSYVMSKLLQKHGRMEGSQVLADTDRWRLAIKKEKDRLVYDEVVKILWPEINFLKEHSKEKDANSAPPPTKTHPGSMVPIGLTFNASTGPLYAASSMLAYGTSTSSDFNFLERARAADCSNVENDIQSALQDLDSHLDPDNQPNDYGLHDHVKGLLQETSTHDNFMFADFLNFCDPQLENNINAAFEKQPPDIAPTTHPPNRPPQIFPPNQPVSTLDPKKLGNSSPPVADSTVLDQTELLAPKADEVPTVPPLLGSLIETIMFQVAVEFIKFITSLGDLLFCLSGCGITSRRKKHEAEGYTRPVQEFGEFVTRAVKLVLEPIKEDLGEVDESADAVLCMADSFVRLGRLHTVREIEEYIITTARHLACDYTSFTTIASKTLKRCLAASDRMTWDHIP